MKIAYLCALAPDILSDRIERGDVASATGESDFGVGSMTEFGVRRLRQQRLGEGAASIGRAGAAFERCMAEGLAGVEGCRLESTPDAPRPSGKVRIDSSANGKLLSLG